MSNLFDTPAPVLGKTPRGSEKSDYQEVEGGTPGAQFFGARAGEVDRAADSWKNHYRVRTRTSIDGREISDKTVEFVDGKVYDPRPDEELTPRELRHRRNSEYNAKTNPNYKPPTPISEWKPQWRDRKREPGMTGRVNNQEKIAEIGRKFEDGLPYVPPFRQSKKEQCLYVPEMGDLLCEFMAAGGTLSQFAERANVSRYVIASWLKNDPALKARFEASRAEGFDAMAEEALRIASEPQFMEETIETLDKEGNRVSLCVKRADAVYARKLAYMARMELLKKWAPDKYGERITVENTDTRAQRILKARQRVMPFIPSDSETIDDVAEKI